MLKIIATGPESSGKTTLCKALSEHFNIPFNKEYAREFLNNLEREYNQNDLIKIAEGQFKSEYRIQESEGGNHKLQTTNHKLSLHDTDLITIKIWSNYKYGNCDKWIIEQIEKQKTEKRIYLLCKPDIPWQADPLRENPNDREELFEIYKQELENLGLTYFIVEGENRTEKSILFLNQST